MSVSIPKYLISKQVDLENVLIVLYNTVTYKIQNGSGYIIFTLDGYFSDLSSREYFQFSCAADSN